jgi:DNA-binding response OmpR family regulator
MTDQSTTRTNVLIVEDERSLADLYAAWLADVCTVQIAFDGDQAIEQFGQSIDIVLLDRQMPKLSGDEVLTHIREQNTMCRVVMVTAVDPDFDIIELEFDEYLTKPVDGDELRTTVERMDRLGTYDTVLRELYRCMATQAALYSEKSDAELAETEAYSELQTQIETLQLKAECTIEEFDAADFNTAFHDLNLPRRNS